MMKLQTLLFTSAYLFLLLPHFFQISQAKCLSSSCGSIPNISYPFRLKHDPKHCGYQNFEIACENNVASLSLYSHKHYVKDINYLNSTITLADASINKHDSCSFPNYSLYDIYVDFDIYFSIEEIALPVNLMSCPYPLKNSSLFTEITHCQTPRSNSSHPKFSYIKVGNMKASEVPESCRLDSIVLTSWEFRDLKNVSLSEIHNSLLYGFQLTWFKEYVGFWGNFLNSEWFSFAVMLLAIVGLVCAACTPVFTIIGFVAVALLILVFTKEIVRLYYDFAQFLLMIHNFNYAFPQLTEGVIVPMILAARFILFPVALWLLIYKFRRRHMSMYNAIESFLQSDNKLVPIRYTYSEIKKMTRGFQDKLGEGGYGFVYKGKLRSGRDVAVKLLGKSGTDGKDFMNEIATIGRVHHVNM